MWSFKPDPGELVAVVWGRGIRQDHLARALGRMVEVPARALFIDGVERHRPGAPLDLRRLVALRWPQEGYLFTASLADKPCVRRSRRRTWSGGIGGAGTRPGRRHPRLPGRLSDSGRRNGGSPSKAAAAARPPSAGALDGGDAPLLGARTMPWPSVDNNTAAPILRLDSVNNRYRTDPDGQHSSRQAAA